MTKSRTFHHIGPSSFLLLRSVYSRLQTIRLERKRKQKAWSKELADLVDGFLSSIADRCQNRKADFDKVDSWAFHLASEFKKQVQGGAKVKTRQEC